MAEDGTTARFAAVVRVVDWARMTGHARTLGGDVGPGMRALVEEVASNPAEPPVEAGYEVTRTLVRRVAHGRGERGDRTFVVGFVATVVDGAVMNAAAERAWMTAWGDERESDPEDAEETRGHPSDAADIPGGRDRDLYELLIGSNASPPDEDVGYEVIDVVYGEAADRMMGEAVLTDMVDEDVPVAGQHEGSRDRTGTGVSP